MDNLKKDLTIRLSRAADAPLISDLARVIWTEHYTPIIGSEQVEFMLDKFQSADAIAWQIENEGYLYYLAYVDAGETLAGYMAIQPDFDGAALFLSKIYVELSHRQKGIARKFIETAKSFCMNNSLFYIWLTVNKNNSSSIAAYEKLGFSIVDEAVTDIGNGFVMDDYIMRMDV